MQVEVVMPKMGESIQEGKILKWLKKEGDKIERDEIILEISTDKVDTEVPSPNGGVLVKLLANEGDTVEVGKPIAIIETEASAAVSAPVVAQAPTPAPAPAVVPTPQPTPAPDAPPTPVSTGGTEVVMPKMGESIQEGKVLRWLKKVGETVERDEILLEISTDKVDTEVPSPVGGTLSEILANEGDVVEVGKAIARIGGAVSASTPVPTPVSTPAVSPAPAPSSVAPSSVATNYTVPQGAVVHGSIPRTSNGRFYSPLVRTIAETEKISVAELDSISGTGLEGRVTKDDVLRYLSSRANQPAPAPTPSTPVAVSAAPAPVAPAPAPTSGVQTSSTSKNWGADVEIIPMDRVRTLIADHMVRSKQTSPHVTSVAEVDVTNIVKLREKYKGEFEKREGVKLTLTPFFCKAIVDAVRQFPLVNVSVDGTNIIRHKNVNLSFATLLPDGNLIVPVIKKSEQYTVGGLAHQISDLAGRARSKKLGPDEIQGGTISLTNMGPWGSLFGTPVINQPQAAIIGVYAVQKRPVVREVNGEDVIAIRHMMYVSITYDHRVIDGALGSGCLQAIVKGLEAMDESVIK